MGSSNRCDVRVRPEGHTGGTTACRPPWGLGSKCPGHTHSDPHGHDSVLPCPLPHPGAPSRRGAGTTPTRLKLPCSLKAQMFAGSLPTAHFAFQNGCPGRPPPRSSDHNPQDPEGDDLDPLPRTDLGLRDGPD